MSDRCKNVYKYIVENHSKLHKIIDELCIQSLYLNNYKESTYLFPNDELLTKIKSNKEEDQVIMLKSLILKGKHDNNSDNDKIYNILYEQIDKPSDLSKYTEHYKKEIWSNDKQIAYKYSGSDIPTATKTEKPSHLSKHKGGGYDMEGGKRSSQNKPMASERFKLSKKLKDEYKENKNVFKEHVASLLQHIKTHHEVCYETVCFLIDDNPIVTWFILLEIGKTENLIIDDKIFNDWHKDNGSSMTVNDPDGIYEECINSNNHNLFSKINSIRQNLIENNCSKIELPHAIIKEYKNFIEDNKDSIPQKLNEIYQSDTLLKLFQDEMRYLYQDNEFFCDIEAIENLNNLMFHNNTQEKYLTICDSELYKKLIKPTTFFLSGIFNFVNSQSFLYVPLNSEKQGKLETAISGGSQIIYKGGKSRRKSSSKKNINLKALVSSIKSLSPEKREELKAMI
jgi:hypothetical protein